MEAKRNTVRYRYSVNNEVVKKLILTYQLTNDSDVFCKILKRVDNLLIHTILGLKRRDRYLSKVSEQELYQISILSLYDCIKSTPKDIDPNVIPARIMAYVKYKVNMAYRYTRKEVLVNDDSVLDNVVEDTFVENTLSSDLLSECCNQLLEDGVVTREELELIEARYVDGRPFSSLGKDMSISRVGVMKKIKRIMKRIRTNVLQG